MAKKGALTGLLLFGIFFGAGNLIFSAFSRCSIWRTFSSCHRRFCLFRRRYRRLDSYYWNAKS